MCRCCCLGIFRDRRQLRKPAALASRLLRAWCLPSDTLAITYGEKEISMKSSRSRDVSTPFLYLCMSVFADAWQSLSQQSSQPSIKAEEPGSNAARTAPKPCACCERGPADLGSRKHARDAHHVWDWDQPTSAAGGDDNAGMLLGTAPEAVRLMREHGGQM